MSFRDRILRVYRRGPDAPLVWQPRLEHWFHVNRREGTLPEKYRSSELSDIYDDLGASVRYFWLPEGIRVIHGPGVSVERREENGYWYTRWSTPMGELVRVERVTWDSCMTVKFPIENLRDMSVMEYVLRGDRYEFDPQAFHWALAEVGDRAAPTVILPRINLQRLFIDFVGYERTIFFLYDHPQETESLIQAIDEADDRLCAVVKDAPYDLVNFGDNVHSDLLPPTLFEQYVFPRYRELAVLFHGAGKFCYPHWDGKVKPLMRYAQSCGFDGIEAITFEPQGDVSIEESKEAMGDVILIDGLPAVLFLPGFSESELEKYTRRVIEAFQPNIILGISDELPPGGDIERCRLVSKIVAEYNSRSSKQQGSVHRLPMPAHTPHGGTMPLS